MNIKLTVIGKTEGKYLIEAVENYIKRLKHYVNFEIIYLPDIKGAKSLSSSEIKEKEADILLKQISKYDKNILFDEKGKLFSSKEFATHLQKQMNQGIKNLNFIVGGAYGFSPRIYQEVQEKISISPMTFSHQMIRLLIVEQIYRANTILNNEPYHKD
jgi:23S rRNA (pseudouridine1915-N3)-methyltransferase